MESQHLESEKQRLNAEYRKYERDASIADTTAQKIKAQIETERTAMATAEKTIKIHVDKIEKLQRELVDVSKNLERAKAAQSKASQDLRKVEQEILAQWRAKYRR